MRPSLRSISAVLAAVAAAGLLAGCTAGTPTASASPDAGIGPWPTFLPTPSPEEVAHGDATAPALSFAGSPVVVTTPAGRMRVNVQGPSDAPDTALNAAQVDCTFTVTLSRASRSIPLTTDMFEVFDNDGMTHALTPVEPLPESLAAGDSVTVQLRATLPAGEGVLRLRPDGASVVAAWDYVIEDD